MSNKAAIHLMYDGSSFCGWQVQPDHPTVQKTLQDALANLCITRPDITGCSRTDSGVHANEYVCHTDADNIKVPLSKLPAALNAYLPSSVSVKSAQLMDEDFHARYSCKGKEYIYKIWNAEYMTPFFAGKALHVPYRIDTDKFAFCENLFTGTHDFRAFMAKGSKPKESYVRTVKTFGVKRQGDMIVISTSADGFLYNMVRIMAGTYLKVASGKSDGNDIVRIIESKDRSLAGETLPACGLYLNKVFY